MNGPRNVKHQTLAKQRPVFVPTSPCCQESVLKVPKRGQFHAAIRVTPRRCDSSVQGALGKQMVSRRKLVRCGIASDVLWRNEPLILDSVSGSNNQKTHYRFSARKVITPHRAQTINLRKRNRTPHRRFSKMISPNAKNLESALLAEPHVAVMFPCRTLTRSAKVSCRTLQIAEPKALNLEKDYLAEPWNAVSFRKRPQS